MIDGRDIYEKICLRTAYRFRYGSQMSIQLAKPCISRKMENPWLVFPQLIERFDLLALRCQGYNTSIVASTGP